MGKSLLQRKLRWWKLRRVSGELYWLHNDLYRGLLILFRKYVGDRAVDQQQGGRGMMRNRIAITAPGAGEETQT